MFVESVVVLSHNEVDLLELLKSPRGIDSQ
jgi:hypothetical protein